MRLLRSLAACALAMCAIAVMTLPSVAAIPIDPGITAMASSHEAYPAPVIQDVDHVALTCEAPAVAVSVSARSSVSGDIIYFRNIDGSPATFIDLRRRC